MPDNISKYNDSLTYAERSDHAREAGKASGRARRARAKLIELSKSPAVMDYLDTHINTDAVTAMADAIIRAACRGNLNAIKFILDMDEKVNGPFYEPDPEQLYEIIIVDEEVCDE